MARFTLALLFIVSLFNYTDRYMIAILLPSIGQEFRLSDTQMGFLSGVAFTLLYVVLGVPIARLADRFSRKRILLIALAVWSLMTAACGVVQNYVQLVFARVLVGIGEAGSSPPSYSVIADLYPVRHRATAMAVYLAGSPAGIVVGFALGGSVASAVLILIINVISGGVGPLAVGMMSDALVGSFGAQSLKLALLIVTPAFSLWAALHYFMGSRTLRADIGAGVQ